MTTKIAVVGSGISGLTASYLLSRKFDVTLFEKSDRLGGHTATMDFIHGGKPYAIDTGFIVFNDWTYPNFIALLDQIGVPFQNTSMGFSVSCEQSGLEYAGNNLNTLFAQRSNLVSPQFLGMLKDIVRFNRSVHRDLKNMNISKDLTIGEYLKKNGYSDMFARNYLVPMGAAIWSASLANMREFPLHFFVHFFRNHGLINILKRPQWKVIQGGSKQYIGPLTSSFKDNIVLNANIRSVQRGQAAVHLTFNDGHVEAFDRVIFATHSDEALALLEDASDAEKSVLGDIPYCENSVVLHTDESLLPANRRTWSSWNYLSAGDEQALPLVTYNMNILQGFEDDTTFCVSLNADDRIDPEKIIGRYKYAHPQFSLPAINAQNRWHEINGVNSTWFCGAYWANGFHEDGVVSALRVAEQFGEFLRP